MVKYRLLTLVFILIFCSCATDEKTLIKMLDSQDKLQIIEATNYIADYHKTHMVKYLLTNAMDPRIIHDLRHKGMSIYQIKMGAMEQLTGIKSVKEITYQPDSAVFKFYLDIVVKKGWMK